MLNVQQWEDVQEELIRLRKENEELRQKLQDKPTIKRELFMEDVLKSDESVRFYTGVPSLSCLQMLSELLRPEAEKLKYWDRCSRRRTIFCPLSDLTLRGHYIKY